MEYKRILTVQDISCVGQCSLTVALPILSACGLETAVLPTAVLSTHTAFPDYTFRDLTDDMPAILSQWEKENIGFSAIYTGYLGSARQIRYVRKLFKKALADGGRRIVDPAMADNGKLYPGFDDLFVGEMKTLVKSADILLPNITEASLLTGIPFREEYDEAYIRSLVDALHALGAPAVVLTGVGYTKAESGVAVSSGEGMRCYRHEKIAGGCHGTGDVFASAFTGAYMRGASLYDAAVIAADFTLACIRGTVSDKAHWYGVKFEPELPGLIGRLKEGESNREKQI